MSNPQPYHDDKTSTIIVWVLIWLIIVLITILWLSNRDRISSLRETDTTQTNTWTNQNNIIEWNEDFVWRFLRIEWIITRWWDISNYTHTFVTTWDTQSQYWLRSRQYSLDNFLWTGRIAGTIRDYRNNMFIIEVEELVPYTKPDTIQQEDSIQNPSIQYIPKAWLYLSNISWDTIGWSTTRSHDANTSTISFSWVNWESLRIQYFWCTNQWSTTNCPLLIQAMQNSSQIDYVSPYWDSFFKMPESNSWFNAFDNKYWYYLETTNKSFLISVMWSIQFIHQDWTNKILRNNAISICRTNNFVLQSIESITIATTNTGYNATVLWTTTDNKKINCLIDIDPRLPLLWSAKNITEIVSQQDNLSWTLLSSWSTSTIDTNNNTDTWDTSTWSAILQKLPVALIREDWVTQFWINLDKPEIFTSRQWYTINFPSKNIAFQSTNEISEKHSSISCTTSIYITSYVNADTVFENPAVKVYICSFNELAAQELSANYFVHQDSANNRIFLVELFDTARFDFAQALTFE